MIKNPVLTSSSIQINVKNTALYKIIATVIILLASHTWLFASVPIILKEENAIVKIDSSYALTWDPISKSTNTLTSKYFTNKNPDKSYWYTFKIQNATKENRNWYLVSYNFTINEIDLIEQTPDGLVTIKHRDTINLKNRFIEHKQPIFNIYLHANETKQYYIRIKNRSSFYYEFALYSPEKFTTAFFHEYLAFGLFYGFMAFVLIYNIFYYSILKEKVNFFYCLFILTQIIQMLYRDGTGLFLTPGLTEYSEMIKNIARSAVVIFMLLYTYHYFKSDANKWLYKWIIAIIVIRIIYAVVMFHDNTLNSFHFELFTLIFCMVFSIYSYKKNIPDAKYMVIGISLLTISYSIYYLSVVALSSLSGVGFFILYYGIALESIFLTLALAERFKRIKLENISTNQMNNELEQIVKKRTSQIEEKNKLLEIKSEELNLFLYSASHDLKGPLKTIEGLCNLGLYDETAPSRDLFNLIKKKLNNLESNISDLNSVTKIQNQDLPFVEINFDLLHQDIVERFIDHAIFSQVSIEFKNALAEPFISDGFSIKSIYQNIFENALKYRDHSRNLLLEIHIEDYSNHIKITFKDNGLGISENILPKIFNMFYRGNNESKDDTGLGLYIVKKAILKLSGTINVASTEGVGTTFEIILPRFKS